MKLYNSLSQKVEVFNPENDRVTIYVCGITPYDTTHLGHAFTYTCADILIRFLERKGLKVIYTQNVTDIDDDILRKAKELREDWIALGNRWTAHYINDMQTLNVRPPDYYPRATDVIPEIIDMIKKLLAEGFAYESNGNVYFQVNSWRNFGKLSGLPRPEMLPIANERGNKPDDPNKRDPLDFVLWQAHSPGEPYWESPWGPGRPGWHIECSTMSAKYLGLPIDIHVGGADLCFPHHECEIAQVEPINHGVPFARFWMHIAMVEYAGAKMSKSLGNLIMVSDLLREFPPDALRFYLASHHYRQPWSYEKTELDQAAKRVDLILTAINSAGGYGRQVDSTSYIQGFERALDDDLDTPAACEILIEFSQAIIAAARMGRPVDRAQADLREIAGVLGIRLDRPLDERVKKGWQVHLERFPVSIQESG